MMRIFIALTVVLSHLVITNAHAQDWSTSDVIPVSGFTQPDLDMELGESLKTLDNGLVGDKIDLGRGSLSFSHTDVSIPGNSALDVSFGRSYTYNGVDYFTNQLGGWNMNIPFMTNRVFIGQQDLILSAMQNVPGFAEDYSVAWPESSCQGDFGNHVITVPGHAGEVNSTWSGARLFSAGGGGELMTTADKVSSSVFGGNIPDITTQSHWRINCVDQSGVGPHYTDTAFEAIDPKGNVYSFNYSITTIASRVALETNESLGGRGGFAICNASSPEAGMKCTSAAPNSGDQGVFLIGNSMILPTEIKDVDGNWVKYEYSGRKLTRIYSNDGREITFTHEASSSVLNPSRVKTVTAKGRVWTYVYGPENTLGRAKLIEVVQPDNRSWTFDVSLPSFTQTSVRINPCYHSASDPAQFVETISIGHPGGVNAFFEISTVEQGFNNVPDLSRPLDPLFYKLEPEEVAQGVCDASFETSSEMSYAVTQKRLEAPQRSDSVWLYDYEQDDGYRTYPNGAANLDLRATTVTNPLGHIEKHFYDRRFNSETHGLLKKVARYDGVTLLETEEYEYAHLPEYGVSGLSGSCNIVLDNTCNTADYQTIALGYNNPYQDPWVADRPVKKTKTTRGTDWHETEYEYVVSDSSPDYSFGLAVQLRRNSSSSVAGERIMDITYEHNKSKWMLGLETSRFQNGRDISENFYDTHGRVIESKRFGQTLFTAGYNADGTMSWVKDALDRETSAANWKRGTPQLITRADSTTIEQDVDDNGWVMQTTNARGYISSYQRDPMGRLTKFTPSKVNEQWDDTVIDYDFTGDGPVQTITKGDAVTTITYDAFHRPILSKTEDRITGWESYVNTAYDGLGRTTFTSQPSDIPMETAGTTSTYDGLGRVLTQDDNTTVGVIDLTNEYLSGHAARVTDAEGEQTITYKNGFGEVIKIEQPDDTTTIISRNEWGQITEVSQGGDHNSFNVDEVQKYEYDAQQRLCRHHTPSGGSDLFEYTAAGELYQSSRGHAFGTGCAAPSGDSLTEYKYDNMGRLELTKYFDELTPFTKRTYDPNGNLKELYRYPHTLDEDPEWENDWRSTSWRYDYNELDMLENETLKIVRRTFELDYDYNLDGSLKESSRSYRHDNWPSGDIYSYDFDYTRDGLGRATGVSMDGTVLTSGAQYYPSGAMELMSYGNGLEFEQELDDRLLPKRLQVLGGPGSSIGHALDLDYTYTPRGMVEAMNDNVDVTNNRFYEYDAQGRLETASGPWGSGSFTYDSLGNIRAKALGSRNITLDYADGRNRVTKSTDSGDTGIRNLTYDNRGNVEYLGEQRFLYTATDRPRVRRSTGAGNGYGKYRYDGHGRRISAWEREDGEWAYRYNAYDASGALVFVVEEENQFPYNDIITHYVKQDGKTVARVKSTSLNSTPEITWLHHDHLGSAVAGTKADGTTAWTEKYTPFGISMVNAADNDNQAGFTGHIKDSDTGLTYMQARYYDPVIGRFLSHDPVGFMVSRPGQFNRYSYTYNDPINKTDPTGMLPPEGMVSGELASGHSLKHAQGISDAFAPASRNGAIGAGIAASLFIPGPEDVAIGVFAATKVGQGLANIGGKIVGAVKGALGGSKVNNPVPDTLARVVPGDVSPSTLGRPGDTDVFVTAADDIAGMNSSQISEALTIPDSSSGFNVIEFPSAGQAVASPVNRSNPGFVGNGQTAGGAREFVVPNQKIPDDATTRRVD